MSVKVFKKFAVITVALVMCGLGLNSCAASGAIKSAPSIDAVAGLNNKLLWLRHNVESGGNYVIEVRTNETITRGFSLYSGYMHYKNVNDISITIKGVGTTPVIIRRDEVGSVFSVGSGITLILEGNIIIQGFQDPHLMDAKRTSSLLRVSSNGRFVMNDGVTITRNTNLSGSGGGVFVGNGGTFLMNGGTITQNTCFPIPDAAVLAASGGKYTNIANPGTYKGGGVYVSSRGTFTKTGGTITGHASDPENGNSVKSFSGTNIIHNNGHAVYAGGKRKETTAGPDINLHFSNGTASGSWDH